MEKHTTLSDSQFENQFRSCELSPDYLSHEAHLRLAWIHIKKYGIAQAEKNIQEQLKAYVESIGARDKYNITLTVAAIKAVYHFMLKTGADNFKDFIADFPRLKFNFKDLMDCHYGFDIFNSSKAKAIYLEPDVLPFTVT